MRQLLATTYLEKTLHPVKRKLSRTSPYRKLLLLHVAIIRMKDLASPPSGIQVSSFFQKALLAVRGSGRAATTLPTTNKALRSKQPSSQRVQHLTIFSGNLGNFNEASPPSNTFLALQMDLALLSQHPVGGEHYLLPPTG